MLVLTVIAVMLCACCVEGVIVLTFPIVAIMLFALSLSCGRISLLSIPVLLVKGGKNIMHILTIIAVMLFAFFPSCGRISLLSIPALLVKGGKI